MNTVIKKEEVVKKSNQPQNGNKGSMSNTKKFYQKLDDWSREQLKTMNEVKTIIRKGGDKVRTTNYVVKSLCFDFKTHKCYGYSYQNIDLIKNPLFSDCENEFHIENNHENYWNRLNPIKSGWYNRRTEIVKVLEVYPIEEFISKFPNEWKNMNEGTSPLQHGFYPIENCYRRKKNKLSLIIDGFIDKVQSIIYSKITTTKN